METQRGGCKTHTSDVNRGTEEGHKEQEKGVSGCKGTTCAKGLVQLNSHQLMMAMTSCSSLDTRLPPHGSHTRVPSHLACWE